MISAIIVEDDPMVALLNQQYLLKSTHQIEIIGVFSNGGEALDFLLTHTVDLVILDMYLPKNDGLQLLHSIRQKNISVEVIMVTAAHNKEEIEESLHLGVIDYLVKPFEFQCFNRSIQKFLKRHTLLSSSDTVSQETIDSINPFPLSSTPDGIYLPKGLQRKTLHKILDHIKSHGYKTFTCKDLASDTQLSIVTTQRYLNFLVLKKELKTDIDYNTGGRPKLIYMYSGNQ